jgi:hypothetical protein
MMEFANNWDFSLSRFAFDPVLHVCMRYDGNEGPDAQEREDDANFKIYYDPSIVPGNYLRPMTAEEIKSDTAILRGPSLPADSPSVYPIKGIFPGELTTGFLAKSNLVGDVLRVRLQPSAVEKFMWDRNGINFWYDKIELAKRAKYPVISEYPTDFLLYAFKNLIFIPEVYSLQSTKKGDHYKWITIPGANRVEICMHKPVLTKIFNCAASDYPEVEPEWHCLAAQELGA